MEQQTLKPWDQAKPKPVDKRVIALFGEYYLVPLNARVGYAIFEEGFVMISNHEVTLTLRVELYILEEDGTPLLPHIQQLIRCVFFDHRPLLEFCADLQFSTLLEPHIQKLRGNACGKSRSGLEGCLDKMVRRWRICGRKLQSAVPQRIRISPKSKEARRAVA